MKVLFKKIKNAGKGYNFFYFTSLILYITFYVFFFRSMLILQGIETALRIALLIFFGLFGILYLIFGLTSMITRKKKVFIPFTIFALIFTILFGISSYYINRIYNVLDNFTTSDTSTYTTVLLTLKDTELTDESVLGMINNEMIMMISIFYYQLYIMVKLMVSLFLKIILFYSVMKKNIKIFCKKLK